MERILEHSEERGVEQPFNRKYRRSEQDVEQGEQMDD